MKCAGKCGKPFHINCINVSDSDYNKYKDIMDLTYWFCDGCKVWLCSAKTMRDKQDEEVKSTLNVNSVCCECFSYIKILTDEVSQMSTNYKHMSENILSLGDEQNKMRSQLDSHAIIISDIALSEPQDRLKPKLRVNVDQGQDEPISTDSEGTKSPQPTFSDSVKLTIGKDDKLSQMAANNEFQPRAVKNLTKARPKPGSSSHSESQALNETEFPVIESEWQTYHKKKRKWPREGSKTLSGPDEDVQQSGVKTSEKTGDSSKRRSIRPNNKVIVGTSDEPSLFSGDKKAWFYLGRVKKGTSIDSVTEFVSNNFSGINVVAEKLDSKGTNDSFKVGVDFHRKDELMNSSIWPKNVHLKRFLFRRTTRKLES